MGPLSPVAYSPSLRVLSGPRRRLEDRSSRPSRPRRCRASAYRREGVSFPRGPSKPAYHQRWSATCASLREAPATLKLYLRQRSCPCDRRSASRSRRRGPGRTESRDLSPCYLLSQHLLCRGASAGLGGLRWVGSTDLEALEISVGAFEVRVHVFHRGALRAFFAPANHLFDLFRRAFEQGFDLPIRHIPHPSRQAEFFGLLPGRVPEEDPLHLA